MAGVKEIRPEAPPRPDVFSVSYPVGTARSKQPRCYLEVVVLQAEFFFFMFPIFLRFNEPFLTGEE
jgi:hypothetical protein